MLRLPGLHFTFQNAPHPHPTSTEFPGFHQSDMTKRVQAKQHWGSGSTLLMSFCVPVCCINPLLPSPLPHPFLICPQIPSLMSKRISDPCFGGSNFCDASVSHNRCTDPETSGKHRNYRTSDVQTKHKKKQTVRETSSEIAVFGVG